jgi:hypothetical protein
MDMPTGSCAYGGENVSIVAVLVFGLCICIQFGFSKVDGFRVVVL